MADPYQAGATLGEALFGDQTATYQGELRKAAQGHDALEQARRNRALRLIDEARQTQRAGITGELVQAALGGDLGAQAELGARTLGSNQTVDLAHLRDFGQPHYGEAQNIRYEGLLGDDPDIGRANRATAFVEDKPYQPIRELGGAYIADAATLGDLDAIPTPSTLSQIEAREAATQIAREKASRPPAARVKPPTAASAENDVLAQARTAIANGADKEAVKARLRDKGYSKLAGRL